MILNLNILCHDFSIMTTTIQAKIKTYLCHEFNIAHQELLPDTNLLDHWVTDSIHLLTIVQFLEQEFSVNITADDMDMKNFNNLSVLTHFVEQKILL
jgi:acyl carrier protein